MLLKVSHVILDLLEIQCKTFIFKNNNIFRCSPNDFCNKERICAPQGVKRDGEEAEDSKECESFYAYDGKCTSDYSTAGDILADFLKSYAKNFKSIDWAGKMSDYSGYNCGNPEAIEDLWTLLEFDAEVSEVQMKCAKPIFNQIAVMSLISNDTSSVELGTLISLSDKDMINFLDNAIPEPSDSGLAKLNALYLILTIICLIAFC